MPDKEILSFDSARPLRLATVPGEFFASLSALSPEECRARIDAKIREVEKEEGRRIDDYTRAVDTGRLAGNTAEFARHLFLNQASTANVLLLTGAKVRYMEIENQQLRKEVDFLMTAVHQLKLKSDCMDAVDEYIATHPPATPEPALPSSPPGAAALGR